MTDIYFYFAGITSTFTDLNATSEPDLMVCLPYLLGRHGIKSSEIIRVDNFGDLPGIGRCRFECIYRIPRHDWFRGGDD